MNRFSNFNLEKLAEEISNQIYLLINHSRFCTAICNSYWDYDPEAVLQKLNSGKTTIDLSFPIAESVMKAAGILFIPGDNPYYLNISFNIDNTAEIKIKQDDRYGKINEGEDIGYGEDNPVMIEKYNKIFVGKTYLPITYKINDLSKTYDFVRTNRDVFLKYILDFQNKKSPQKYDPFELDYKLDSNKKIIDDKGRKYLDKEEYNKLLASLWKRKKIYSRIFKYKFKK